jgi:crossover junction endodeoxyribonuclease RusA
MTDYKFTLPWPPTVNHWHQPVKMGKGVRVIKSKNARAYESLVIEVMKALKLDGEALECKLSVSLVLNPPTLARYDIDNRTKGVFDGLSAAGFWLDDEQVVSLHIQKGEKQSGGNVFVKVTKLN